MAKFSWPSDNLCLKGREHADCTPNNSPGSLPFWDCPTSLGSQSQGCGTDSCIGHAQAFHEQGARETRGGDGEWECGHSAVPGAEASSALSFFCLSSNRDSTSGTDSFPPGLRSPFTVLPNLKYLRSHLPFFLMPIICQYCSPTTHIRGRDRFRGNVLLS